jgi:hypothetical protein
MTISSVTQTIATPPVASASSASATGTTARSFTASAPAGTSSLSTLSSNPIASLSSDLQSYLLQQQSQGTDASQGKSGHHHHGHSSGTRGDAPNLPGSGQTAAKA